MERSRSRMRRGGLAASILAVAASVATAQVVVPPGTVELEDAEIFRPTTDVGDFITVYDTDAVPPGRFTLGFWGDYAQDPLEIQFEDSEDRFSKLVEQLGTAQFTGAVGIADRFALGLRVPLYITELEEVVESGSGSTDDGVQFNVGDVTVNGQFTLLKRREVGIGIAIIPEVTLPSGSEDDFAGTGEFGYGGLVAVDFEPGERFRLGFNAGGMSRGSPFNDQLRAGAAAGLDVTDSVTAIVETYTATSTRKPFSRERKTPVDVIGALQFHLGQVNLTVGGGAGVTRGQGSPDFRVFVGVTPPKPEEDELLVAGDLSQSRKISSLRDMDRDGRTSPGDILEYTITMVNSGSAPVENVRVVDPIPASTRYLAGTLTVNGTPMSDAIEDDAGELSVGPPDAVVARIQRLEPAGSDGQPVAGSEATIAFQVEIDRELTTVTTIVNLASAAAEGVPEFPLPPAETTVFPAIRESERVIVTPDRIELTEEIHFEFDKAIIQEVSYPILKELAGVLQQYPALRVSIEGHTDSVGTEDYNQKLSEKRALAVRDFLVGVGIEQSRLQWVGRGESAPIASNDTPTGRAKNRRTEFLVLNPEALGGKAVERRPGGQDIAPESEPAWLKRRDQAPD
jgi:large repetitive protein